MPAISKSHVLHHIDSAIDSFTLLLLLLLVGLYRNRLRRRKESLIAEGIINNTKTGVATSTGQSNGANGAQVAPRLTSDALHQVVPIVTHTCMYALRTHTVSATFFLSIFLMTMISVCSMEDNDISIFAVCSAVLDIFDSLLYKHSDFLTVELITTSINIFSFNSKQIARAQSTNPCTATALRATVMVTVRPLKILLELVVLVVVVWGQQQEAEETGWRPLSEASWG